MGNHVLRAHFKGVALIGVVVGLLAGPGPAQAPKGEVELKIQVFPAEATLVVESHTLPPHSGTYSLSRNWLRPKVNATPVLRSPGFADLPLPPVNATSLASYSPGGPYRLQPTSLAGYRQAYPWVAPALVLAGLAGAAGLWLRGRSEKDTPFESPEFSPSPDVAPTGPEAGTAEPPPPATPDDPMVGAPLGRYHIAERIGMGGMATVYKAYPMDGPGQGEPVAVKIIRPDQVSAEYQSRFEREIMVSMKLNHPNVMRIIDWGQEGNLTYLVMEYVDGIALHRCIPAGGMSLEEAMLCLPGVIEALAYAHSLGIVHRDIKPENVMIARSGLVKLMDFGLARNQEVRTVTVMGNAVGTPAYMAPEQVLRGPNRSGLTDKSDQYALGILIFEVLCGRRPFTWDDPIKLITQHLTEDPPSVREFRPDVPVAVEAVVNRMLSKEPEGRYPSIKEAGAALFKAMQEVVPSSASSLQSLEAIDPAHESLTDLQADERSD